MITYFVLLWAASLLQGYVLAFSGATLSIGMSISDSDTQTGFQDAITPPWTTNLTLLSYLISAIAIGYGWYQYDFITGVGVTLGFIFLIAINKVILLPKSESNHFRKLIVHSMINRYADFKKANDETRANAMEMLLEKLGVSIPDDLRK